MRLLIRDVWSSLLVYQQEIFKAHVLLDDQSRGFLY